MLEEYSKIGVVCLGGDLRPFSKEQDVLETGGGEITDLEDQALVLVAILISVSEKGHKFILN